MNKLPKSKWSKVIGIAAMYALLVLWVFMAPLHRAFAQQATTHSVTLTWNASGTPNVTYNVYRATSSTGPFTAVASGLTALTYIDTSAVDGTEYFYEVDAVLGTDLSGPSNVVNATEPVNPLAPAGLAATAQ